jgi:hypothetical protein
MKSTVCCLVIWYLGTHAICNKRSDCSQTVYSFEAFFKAFPDKDSIKIGDTIWLELNTPVQLKDILTNQMVDYSGAINLGTAIAYLDLTATIPAANHFDNIPVKGSVVQSGKPDQIREFLFAEENGTYRFKIGIVAKNKGLFAIGPGNAANVYTRKNKCDKAGFNLTFKDTDQHLYLYEQSRPGYQPSAYERTHMYCFRVY